MGGWINRQVEYYTSSFPASPAETLHIFEDSSIGAFGRENTFLSSYIINGDEILE